MWICQQLPREFEDTITNPWCLSTMCSCIVYLHLPWIQTPTSVSATLQNHVTAPDKSVFLYFAEFCLEASINKCSISTFFNPVAKVSFNSHNLFILKVNSVLSNLNNRNRGDTDGYKRRTLLSDWKTQPIKA